MQHRLASTFLAVALLATPTALAAAAPGDGDGQGRSAEADGRSELLPGYRFGERAINELGDRLPEAARRNGLSPNELVQQLRDDDDLWLDPAGLRLFIDAAMAEAHDDHEEAGDAVGDLLADTTSIPTSQAFQLSSRPGAARTILLDFDGHVMGDTAWRTFGGGFPEDYQVDAWDVDGSPATFGETERRRIIETWAWMAEDFAPFDVNVTTVDPGAAALERTSSGDSVYGTRVLFAGDAARDNANCGCGGVAYVGTFDHTSSGYYQPAWVFPGSLGNSSKNMAEAGSHEAGHNLGLSHDGKDASAYYTGHAGWAPIMGVGYYEPVSQWSRGEYGGATETQDDLQVIQANGLARVADDHPAGPTGAEVLGPVVDTSGVISDDTDVDAFVVEAGAGTIDVSALPAQAGPNLDVRLTLRDADGALVAADDPTMQDSTTRVATGMSARVVATVAAGTYLVTVEGVGVRTADTGYTGYGSLGAYTLTGTVPEVDTTNQPPTALAGADPNNTGVVLFDAGSSDPDGDALTLEWTDAAGAPVGTGPSVELTLEPGTYTYTLTASDPDGLSDSDDVTFTVEPSNAAPTALAQAYVTNGQTDPANVTLNGTDSTDPDGDVLTHVWRDATGTVVGSTAIVDLTLPGPGTYTFELTVSDPGGLTGVDTTTYSYDVPNTAPTAVATVQDGPLVTGEGITLDGAGSSDPDGDALNHVWYDGSGAVVWQGATYVESFDVSGSYTRRLVVDDGRGGTDEASVVLDVVNEAPTAFFGAQGTSTAGDAMTFAASGSSDSVGIESYDWTFDDGATASGETVTHTWAAAGTYLVTLTVTDIEGATDQYSRSYEIAPGDEPLGPVTGLTAVDDGSGRVVVSWQAAPSATSYDVVREERHPRNGKWLSTTTLGTTTGTSFTDGTVANTTYRYQVIATDGSATAASSYVTVTVTSVTGGGGDGGGGNKGGGKGGGLKKIAR